MADVSTVVESQQWWNTEAATEGFTTLTITVIVVSIIVAVIVIYFVVSLYLRWRNRAGMLRHDLNNVQYLVDKNTKRINLLETHAVDYYHSMSPGATQALSLARQVVTALHQVCEEVKKLIATEDIDALADAEKLLQEKVSLSKDSFHSVGGDEIPLEMYADEWGSKLDELLEIVGRDISVASTKARDVSPKKRESRRTYYDLVEAGIRMVVAQGRRFTHSFKSPFQSSSGSDEDAER